MTSTKISFTPCTFATEMRQLVTEDSDASSMVLAQLDDRACFEQHQQVVQAAVTAHSGKILIFPIGLEGEQIWQSLPANIAVLITPPQRAALILLPTERSHEAPENSCWEWIVDHAEELVILPGLKTQSPIALDWPALIPDKMTMPHWLSAKCAEIVFTKPASESDVIAIKAGLFQIHNDLNRSHEYAQDCQGNGWHVAGDYWHGIMHRREPDFGNAKYWFRRVGKHPIFDNIVVVASEILSQCHSPQAPDWKWKLCSNGWSPNSFVDLCETCANSDDQDLMRAAQEIQWREMLLLLEQTYRDAVGNS